MIDCNECVWEKTCAAHRGGVIACPDGRVAPAPPAPRHVPIYCYTCRKSTLHIKDSGNEEKCTVCGSHRAA